ncbi:MAG: archaellin/type IV pilin N-terminal domain-containing protein [Nanobdellota archaeon]
MGVFSSKQAMSPLIATVLLIAFAVALGVMIMNWSSGVGEESHGVDDETCSLVELSLSGNFCYTGSSIQLGVKNTGEKNIDALSIQLQSDVTDYSITLKNSKLISGESASKEIPYASTGDSTTAIIIPLVAVDGELHKCDQQGFSKELVSC